MIRKSRFLARRKTAELLGERASDWHVCSVVPKRGCASEPFGQRLNSGPSARVRWGFKRGERRDRSDAKPTEDDTEVTERDDGPDLCLSEFRVIDSAPFVGSAFKSGFEGRKSRRTFHHRGTKTRSRKLWGDDFLVALCSVMRRARRGHVVTLFLDRLLFPDPMSGLLRGAQGDGRERVDLFLRADS